MKKILINTEGLQTRVAIVEDGGLSDYFIERRDTDRLVGSIYKGVIRNLEPSLQAAFVDIGTDKNAFLHYWDMLPATQEALEGGDTRPRRRTRRRPPPERQQDQESPKGLLAKLKRRFSASEEQPVTRRRRRRSKKAPMAGVEDIPDLFKVDSEVLVQVTKGPIGTKGARVTTNLSIPGRYLVLLPRSPHVGVSKRVDDPRERDRLRQILRRLRLPDGMGLICRTVGAGKQQRFFEQDLDMLLGYWSRLEDLIHERRAPWCVYQEPDLVGRSVRDYLTEEVDEIVADAREACDCAQEMVRRLSRQERVRVKHYKGAKPIFQRFGLEDKISSIFRRQVPLPSGGYLCVDETEALIAIDVNSGKNRSGKDHPETILQTNLEAVEVIAKQLRLRNVGGLLVLDLIDMRSKRDQQTVFRTLKQALAEDRAKTKAYPISPLGLVEMTRQREHESLRDTVFSPCPYCQGKGVVKSAASVSVEIQRHLQQVLRRRRGRTPVRIMVHPEILERLKNEDAELLVSLEKEFGGELSFRGDPSLHMEEFRLTDPATGQSL